MAWTLPDAWLDDLRSRLNIVDIVSEHVPLKQKGDRYWGLCPFHNEKTASFSVSVDSQLFYCFGCHKGGTVIHFCMEIERMEFFEAVSYLAEKARFPLPNLNERPDDARGRELRERIFEANTAAAHFYHEQIWTSEGARALAYLGKRGLDDGDIRRFGLGAADAGWDSLTRTLSDKGFEMEVLIKAGLTLEKDGRRFDMFRDRVMFPIINAQGRVLGFGGRALTDSGPKYLNTSDTPIFNKRQELYALNFARKERSLKRMLLVEGYMDVLSLRKHGVEGVVATLGTALTEEQARLIKRYVSEVWVCYDGDAAGQKAAVRALDILEAQNVRARVLAFPDGMDPDDYIRSMGKRGFEELTPMDGVEYRMERAQDGKDMGAEEDRMRYAIEACEILRNVQSPVERDRYLARLAMQTGYERETLKEQIGVSPARTQKAAKSTYRPFRKEEVPDYVKAETTLIMLLGNRLIARSVVSETDFITPVYQTMAGMFIEGLNPAQVLERLTEEERQAGVESLNMEIQPDEKNALSMAEDCLTSISRHKIEQGIERLRREAEKAQGEERARINRKLVELMQESQRLKTGRKEWTD